MALNGLGKAVVAGGVGLGIYKVFEASRLKAALAAERQARFEAESRATLAEREMEQLRNQLGVANESNRRLREQGASKDRTIRELQSAMTAPQSPLPPPVGEPPQQQ